MQDLEARIIELIRDELGRQAEESGLMIVDLPGVVRISGDVDLEALAMAIAGALSGGP
ncbi:MAG TPA: hypothetical protein VF633_09885 [Brevundimonas sp.]|jgi:hypothetical protein